MLLDDAIVAMNGLRRIQHALRTASHSAETTHGVSGAQLFVLQQLDERPGSSLADLAALTMTDPSSVSVVVKRLVDAGCVRRRQTDEDARRAALTLTKKGAAIVARAAPMPQERLTRALSKMPPRDVRRLSALLDTLADTAGLSKSAPMFFERRSGERSGGERSRG
jgi:DNA-binding MarR family transcriptional regulator